MSPWDDVQTLVGGEDNATILAITVSVVAVLITTLVLWFCRGSRVRGRSILLVGLNGSGKTLMFCQLRYGEEKHTVMSIAENKCSLTLDVGTQKKTVELVDIPGHDSIRNIFINKYLSSARSVVLVVDSSTFSRDVRDIAKLLYSVLANPLASKNRLSLLIACNKQDIPTAKSDKLMQQMLEKEIDALRTTRAAALSDTDDAKSPQSAPVGRNGKEFAFADVLPITVEMAECCARSNSGTLAERTTDLSAVRAWLVKQA